MIKKLICFIYQIYVEIQYRRYTKKLIKIGKDVEELYKTYPELFVNFNFKIEEENNYGRNETI